MNGTSASTPSSSQSWLQSWIQRGTSRLAQLLLLAVTVLVYSVLGMAIANSLFISYVGAEHLPQAFMLIGLCSVPAYVLFSQIVDRYSRPKLFRYILLISVFAVLGLRLLLTQESPYVYYLLLIAIFFQWDFHNNVLYPSLLTDYWTTLEYKRYVPYVGVAQAVGTLIGGGVTTVLSHYLRTRDLLYCLPVVFLIGVAQLIYLDRSQRRLNSVGKTETQEVGIIESLRTFPELVQRYPLALFLAGSSFLLVIIYISSEFLWFNIYGQNFSDQELTGFLGLMRILISVIQMSVVYGITRPLLKNIGVAQMNAVYPVTTLISLGGLLSNFGLPAAIGLHINGDALYKSINLPVHQLNYNAIPRESVARIRALSDGLIYAVGLTLAGAILWFSETRLSLTQISWGVVGLAVVFLLVRLPMGRFYANGLEGMIRSNSIDLDDFEIYPVPLPLQSAEAVRELLKDEDRYVQRKGLELASLIEQPSQFLTEIEAIVPGANASPIYDQALALFCPPAKLDDELEAHFKQQLQKQLQDPILQAFALEVLLSNQSPFESNQIATWQASSEAEISILGNLAQLIAEPSATLPWPAELSRSCARIIIRIATKSDNPALQSLIPNLLLKQESPEILRTSLEALESMVKTGEGEIAAIALQASQDIAQTQLNHADPMVRIAAFDLLGIVLDPDQLCFIGKGLRDADQRVRDSAAKALAAYGRPGLDVAEAYLHDVEVDAVNAAIKAIGLVRTRYASNLLFNSLASDYKQFIQTRRWQQQIPADDPSWEALGVAIADYHDRLIQKVLYVLSALGHSRTVNSVNQLLNSYDQAALENAIEVLASLNHRRFVIPLMPLLEARVSGEENNKAERLNSDSVKSLSANRGAEASPQWLRTKGYRLLLEALESKDRWIKTGALIALTGIPSALVNDPDPLVKQVASQIFGEFTASAVPGNGIMNRLLLLKRVALFKNLSMDELLLIDQGLAQTQVSEGEAIFSEGDWGVHLYIIASGQVQLVKAVDGATRELKQLKEGQYFGEVALFDDAPRWDGAMALSDCTLLKLEKGRFLSLVTQRPHIILEMCRFLSQRLRETDKYRFKDVSEGKQIGISPSPSPEV